MVKSTPRDESDLVDETPGIGHNSVAAQLLEKYCLELEAIAEQKALLTEATSDIMTLAKSKGFKPVHIREALKLRKMSQEKREEFLHTRDTYLNALRLV